MMAVQLYAKGKLSLGKSAELANLCKYDFVKLLAQNEVGIFNWDDEEIEREFNNVKKILGELENEGSN